MVYILPVARRRALLACSSNAPKVISFEWPATSTPSRRTFPIAFNSPPLGCTHQSRPLAHMHTVAVCRQHCCAMQIHFDKPFASDRMQLTLYMTRAPSSRYPASMTFARTHWCCAIRTGGVTGANLDRWLLFKRACAVSLLNNTTHLLHRWRRASRS
jgi:hypothetical protein